MYIWPYHSSRRHPSHSRSNAHSSAAHFLARLSTRPDCDAMPKSVMKRTMHMISSDESSSNRHNPLNLFAKILKIGQRNIVLPLASTALQADTHVTEGEELKHPPTLDMHLATKLAQRIVLSHLPPRTCLWRYHRSSRFLFCSDAGNEGGADVEKGPLYLNRTVHLRAKKG